MYGNLHYLSKIYWGKQERDDLHLARASNAHANSIVYCVCVCVCVPSAVVTLQRPKSEFLGTHEPLFVILFVKKTQTIFKMLTHADTHRYASCRSHRFLLYQNEYSYFSENPCKRNYFQIPFYGNDYGRHLLSQ